MKNHHAFKHGHCVGHRTKIYSVWSAMIQRTTNSKNKYYRLYGGRGINVCDEWKTASVFIDWALSNGYRKGLEINRIDNDGDYCPDNCNFVDHYINNQNKQLRPDYGIAIWHGYYRVKIMRFGKSICKYAKSIEEAREIKKQILSVYENNL